MTFNLLEHTLYLETFDDRIMTERVWLLDIYEKKEKNLTLSVSFLISFFLWTPCNVQLKFILIERKQEKKKRREKIIANSV